VTIQEVRGNNPKADDEVLENVWCGIDFMMP
jgi:hypothetical protein